MPVTIIGGYLGSGKTTLVNHLIRQANGVRLAVLVNDFGELPIDGDLIEAQHGNVITLSGGCVCCSYGDDLSAALASLQSGADQPDHIIVEASGVALPGAIGKTLSLLRHFQLEGIVVLADSSTVVEHASAKYIGDTIERQLHDADLIVLNKLDLVTSDQASAVRQWLGTHYSHAPHIDAVHSVLDPDVFFSSRQESLLTASAEDGHDAGVFSTFRLNVAEKVDACQMAANLADRKSALVRAKGFVLDKDDCMKTIQVVGRRWSVTSAPENVMPGLICIGLSGAYSEELVRSFANQG